MASVVVDASVVLAILDPGDALHEPATGAVRGHLQQGDRLILPASALAEVLVGASRIGAEAVEKVESFVDSVIDSVQEIDRTVAREAAQLRARHRSLRLPDALVLAAATIAGADRILTGDAAWRRVDPRVSQIRTRKTRR